MCYSTFSVACCWGSVSFCHLGADGKDSQENQDGDQGTKSRPFGHFDTSTETGSADTGTGTDAEADAHIEKAAAVIQQVTEVITWHSSLSIPAMFFLVLFLVLNSSRLY